MTRKPVSNIAASVRQRLLNRARESSRPFNELLQYYALERFLYRLAESSQSELFILKGAMMLRVYWGDSMLCCGSPSSTMDCISTPVPAI